MIDYTDDISKFFKILADQTRLRILKLLNEEKRSSDDIQTRLNKSQSTISQHLKLLQENNLITSEQVIIEENNVKRKINIYSIRNPVLMKIISQMQFFIIELQKEDLQNIKDIDRLNTLFE